MTRFTPSQVISFFPTKPDNMPKICTLTTKPNYQSITEFQRKLDANLLAVPCDTCTLGHLAIAVKKDEFKTLNGGKAFDEPTDPGPKAPIQALKKKSTDEERAMMPYTAAESLRVFAYEKEE